MATLRTRLILSFLLVTLPYSFAPAGPPPTPSPPECYMPCDESQCSVDIHCTWDPGPDPLIPTNYSLHWAPVNRMEENGTSQTRVIFREHFFNQEELVVWVVAKNQYDVATSHKAIFNTADIIKPPPPYLNLRQQEPFEIEWKSFCDELQFSVGTCDVRNRIEADQVWFEHEGGFHHTYTFDNPQPGTVYEFQVRCACSIGVTSNWSTILKSRSAEKAPVGHLNIWRDCGISPASFDCALMWKKLPISQARGLILGYEVRLFYKNGTLKLVNVSTAEPRGQLLCDEMKCHLKASLKDVSSVNVSAFNAHGATVPSRLVMTIPTMSCPDYHKSKEKNQQAIYLQMNEENLTVSWDLPSQLSDNLKEYVVQYKEAGCPPGQGFDWVRMIKSQTTAFFKGQFEKDTHFEVSLFSVSSDTSDVHCFSSAVGYSCEGPPSRVPLFKVFSIAGTEVTLFWMPVPLSKQNGVIQYYQIGLDRQNVYNVSAPPTHENGTFMLKHLSPDQEYEVWIRAVTSAGPGANATISFKTKQHENNLMLITVVLLPLLVIVCILLLFSSCQGANKICPLVTFGFSEKVPDPRNSHIFRQRKHQMNDTMGWIHTPFYETHPQISMLEVVEIQPEGFKSFPKKSFDPEGLTKPAAEDKCSQKNCKDHFSEDAVTEECGTTEQRYRREDYSKMVDSDEEKNREEDEDDCWNSSEEEQFTSGYEKHFMPSALEILKV